MKNTALRRIATLRLIPKAPLWVTTTELAGKLETTGYDVTQRSVQRDMEALSVEFPLQHKVAGRTYQWQWPKNAEVLDIPGMNPYTALSFFLTEQYLDEMMPPIVTDALEQHFNRAKVVLREPKAKAMDKWIDKVRALPETMPLVAPKVNSRMADTIYTALLEDKVLSAKYTKRGEKRPARYDEIHPLGLVFRNRVIYLLATLWGYDSVVQLALHRFKSVSINDEAEYRRKKNFNLDEYIRQGHFDYILGSAINIELLFEKGTAEHLDETPMTLKQTMSKTRDGRVRVKATVLNTDRLRWWLKGFGEYVEVVKPASLRKEFTESAKKLAGMYGRK